MASTSGCRWKDYSSACVCSTDSCAPADERTFHTMTDQYAELDVALERVFEAAKAHLAAVKAAQGRVDDDDVWQAYVNLNNTSFAYDEQLLDAYGEVTPWDVESIDPDEADQRFGLNVGDVGPDGAGDPYPQVVSVRQRRDYR